MLELRYTDGKITATLGHFTAEIKESNRDTGDWTLNVIKNYFDSFGVTYEESGVEYNKDATLDLVIMPDADGTVHLGIASEEPDEWLELEGFGGTVACLFETLGASSC